ncbi:hydrolase 1, exosortase A system-associated [Sphingomonas sp.]|jgi:exosortase A-associated hydrolase 1|uniref:hydrolase 1, exosortase A system-associated n=1 Tax=Sphingomonas sp. TaxID=28214 RepID=UPI0035C8666E
MTRSAIVFEAAGEPLVGSLDSASGTTGLLIVSGGNEVRAGAHRGMALLAARLAGDGIPVFRYDRRGVGDSAGINRGNAEGTADLAAALDIFRRHAPVTRIVAFGNCDAAALLARAGGTLPIDRLVLANPWLMEESDTLPPAAAIRATYADKLRRPSEWRRLLSGGVNLRKLARGVRKSLRAATADTAVIEAIIGWGDRATIVLAERDHTARAFDAAARNRGLRIERIASDSHSFARPGDMAALEDIIRAAL